MAAFDPATMIAVEQDVVGCELGESLALLNLKSNIYYSLNDVGAFIWSEMSEPVSFEHLCRRTEAEFGADPEQVSRDIAALVSSMDEAKLVRCFAK